MAHQRWSVRGFMDRPYNICCVVLGALLIINSLICAIVYQNIQLFVRELETNQLAVSQNTLFLSLWKNPPMTPQLQVYIFNFTNAYEYLAGNDSKPNFEVSENRCDNMICIFVVLFSEDENSIQVTYFSIVGNWTIYLRLKT